MVRMPPKLCSNVLDACPSTPSTGPLPGSPMPASRTAAVGSAGTEAWFSATTRCADETVFPSQRTFGWTRHLTHMHSQTHTHTHTRTHTGPHPRMHQPAAFNTQHCKAAIATLRRENIAYPDYRPSTTLAYSRRSPVRKIRHRAALSLPPLPQMPHPPPPLHHAPRCHHHVPCSAARLHHQMLLRYKHSLAGETHAQCAHWPLLQGRCCMRQFPRLHSLPPLLLLRLLRESLGSRCPIQRGGPAWFWRRATACLECNCY